MSERKKVQRRGRTIQLTLNELFESPRFRIAVSLFPSDPSFMRAILTELYLDTVTVVKSKLIKTYNNYNGLDQYEMIPLLRSVNDFDSFQSYWGLSPIEAQLYSTDPKFKLSDLERADLLAKLHEKFMQSGLPIDSETAHE